MKNTLYILLIGILFSACQQKENEKQTHPQPSNPKIHVGVFDGNGASVICVSETIEALKIDSEMEVKAISAKDIENGKLSDLDALVFPGGSGSKEFNNLGYSAAQKVKSFGQTKGKGLVGICAGGYLFATTPSYPSLQIIEARNIREFYNRGRGLIAFQLTEEGKEIFPELSQQDTLFVQYYDGPIYDSLSEKLHIAGTVISDIATHKGYPKGVTPGKPAFVNGEYGEGRVFVSIGHPEATAGMRWIVPRMVRWTLKKELITYGNNVIRPFLNDKELLFYSEQSKAEKDNFWKLFDSNDEIVIQSIHNLHALRSRTSIRWSIGLLRHKSPKVVLEAAKYLVESEYTPALGDLKTAAKQQTEPNTKKILESLVIEMEGFIGSK